jgi:hypothetical protein
VKLQNLGNAWPGDARCRMLSRGRILRKPARASKYLTTFIFYCCKALHYTLKYELSTAFCPIMTRKVAGGFFGAVFGENILTAMGWLHSIASA